MTEQGNISNQFSFQRIPWSTVERKLKKKVAELLGLPVNDVSLEANWETDLKGDSLDAIEYVMACEDMFGIEISDEMLIHSKSIADTIRTIMRQDSRTVFERVDCRLLNLRLRPNGHIEVSVQLENGSWVFADGSGLLPSKLYVIATGKWAAILQELEEMINNPVIKEQDLQEFFESHPELLVGDDYDQIIPQAVISRENQEPWRADFVLAPIKQTQFAKIIDLKLPREKLSLNPRGGHVSFSAKLSNSISQLKDYGNAFDDNAVRKKFFGKYKIDVYKPDLQLIIGRKWNFDWIDNIKALRKEAQVGIETWDDMIDRLRRRLT